MRWQAVGIRDGSFSGQARLEPNYYRFLCGTKPKLQALAILLALLNVPLTYFILHIPKIIVDDGIQGTGFPKNVFGIELDQVLFLISLCVGFLLLNIASGFLKLKLNTLMGYISETGLRDLRMAVLKHLHDEINRDIPVSQKSQIVIPEMEAFGGFIGDFSTIPVVQVSTMGTIVFFMFEQSPLLGLAAIAIIPAQAIVVPILQKRIVKIKKLRIKIVRNFASAIEMHDGGEFRNAAHLGADAETAYRIYTKNILKNRILLYRAKYLLKFINNLLAKATPFLFYLVGGLLVIKGDITLGSLTAALVAYQQLDEPWRVLVQFFQRLSTTKMQYQQVLARVGAKGV
ncbi:ABC transporter ATP-binding protein [Ruegeria atlantica]|uniref:ABC transporter ATP-binding protein n=1 Tax=Ruegeria atlantica TaxID=81569 RepID=UPI00148033CF|nr:ABC transporter ATP-binding protein [Ruegeria atlantica]